MQPIYNRKESSLSDRGTAVSEKKRLLSCSFTTIRSATNWVTDEDPLELSQFKQEVHDFQPPLDSVEGVARVCDPFFDGMLAGKHWCGKFLKDYFPIDW